MYKCFKCNKELSSMELAFNNNFKNYSKKGLKFILCSECSMKEDKEKAKAYFKKVGMKIEEV